MRIFIIIYIEVIAKNETKGGETQGCLYNNLMLLKAQGKTVLNMAVKSQLPW